MIRGVFTISVPGSTANLGPGFDSVGMAVDRYLTLHVERGDEWRFIPLSENLDGIPVGKDNLIYEVATAVADESGLELPPCEVRMYSDIPMSRGLGSSAAAIVAGIELANQLLDLGLSAEAKVRRASVWEGHPDNVAASVYGGLVIGSHRGDDGTDVVLGGCPEIDIVAVVPSYELKTVVSRDLLPRELAFGEAVKASGVSNVLVAALLQGRWDLAGKMMSKDFLHQPYRKEVVPELKVALELVDSFGDGGLNVYGASLSGAGPIVLFYTPEDEGSKLVEALEAGGYFREHELQVLKADKNGVSVKMVVGSMEA
ncbi:homoserine kinase [Evansella vedderi]|uniref:Homoserine kinase n=1 Tax=Evansella vedderi TaxID=38282 RepID=A0ABU0A0B7_9BACI|nr:homoserine kinase [Evansella vedderi]MDQ0256936.1 homoserine kinase [Evansella vedderi]